MIPHGFESLIFPEGMGSAVICGRSMVPDEKGQVLVLHSEVAACLSHGFKPIGSAGPKAVADMNRDELIRETVQRTMDSLTNISTEELRERLAASTPADPSLPGETLDDAMAAGSAIDVHGVKDEDVEGMSFFDLKKFLKASGVTASNSLKYPELRALAHRVFVDRAEADKESISEVLGDELADLDPKPEFPFAKG